jgi:hypothetical protein
MQVYLKSDQVLESFKRLASRKSEGKTPMERTSVLMYFLAFDAVQKNVDQSCLDFNPDKTEGKNNRKLIELEFTKLTLLGKDGQRISQVCELGKITTKGKAPEKRISSNFLTVPLKKASEQTKLFSYPNRPSTPLIKMGPTATSLKWGMQKHEDWRENLPKLFSEIKAPTVFTDLSIFVLRDSPFPVATVFSHIEALSISLNQKFTADLADFWIDRIKKEQVMVKHIQDPFTNVYDPLLSKCNVSDNGHDPSDYHELKKRISYLEDLLKRNKIPFKNKD